MCVKTVSERMLLEHPDTSGGGGECEGTNGIDPHFWMVWSSTQLDWRNQMILLYVTDVWLVVCQFIKTSALKQFPSSLGRMIQSHSSMMGIKKKKRQVAIMVTINTAFTSAITQSGITPQFQVPRPLIKSVIFECKWALVWERGLKTHHGLISLWVTWGYVGRVDYVGHSRLACLLPNTIYQIVFNYSYVVSNKCD